MLDVIIIGAGPAGLSAGLYTSRMGLSTLILDKGLAGGQLLDTETIDNYIGGRHKEADLLADDMRDDALAYGAELKEFVEVTSVKKVENGYRVETTEDVFTSKALLLATGTKHNHLLLESHDQFIAKGISYCAVCDAPFFQDKEVIVVGGGDSALEAAILNTQYAKHVTLLVRNQMRAKPHLIEQAKQLNVNITHGQITKFIGDDKLTAVRIAPLIGEPYEQAVDGVFVMIGSKPDVEYLADHIYLSDVEKVDNYLVPMNNQLQTGDDGLFIAGDLSNPKHRQIAIAVGEGAKAGLEIYEYLQK